MKRLSFFVLFSTFFVNAFSQAREGKVSYQRTQQPAAVIDLPYPSSVVQTAIVNHLGAKGAKGNDSRGFKTFKNVRIGDTLTGDLYFKVDRKSQNESTVYLVVTSPNENLSARTVETNYGLPEARQFLNEIAPSAEASNLDKQVKDQQEEVSKAERRLKNLMEDESDLTKRKQSIEQKIVENQQQQEKQKIEIEKQRQALSSLMERKRS